ncbi:MAG TPA: beta galactosidase jelly roll domain-containing protein, partial [Niastella sp.]|nr:beta galactosidase jelly roll domain-containing protein [Niastella sp.]
MYTRIIFYSIFFYLFVIAAKAQPTNNQVRLFDDDWQFFRGGSQRAETVTFDDSKWRRIDLPHDWSIEDLPGTNSPFNPAAISQVNGGFTTGGTAWYRKTFTIPAAQKEQKTIIQFDGIYMNAEVWLNGKPVGNHRYGYTSFWYDITGYLNYDSANVLAVKVKNEGENSRWYSGSGIYRHVWLKVIAPVHIAQWGTYITTPEVTAAAARVVVKTKVQNQSGRAADVTIVTRIRSAKG